MLLVIFSILPSLYIYLFIMISTTEIATVLYLLFALHAIKDFCNKVFQVE